MYFRNLSLLKVLLIETSWSLYSVHSNSEPTSISRSDLPIINALINTKEYFRNRMLRSDGGEIMLNSHWSFVFQMSELSADNGAHLY